MLRQVLLQAQHHPLRPNSGLAFRGRWVHQKVSRQEKERGAFVFSLTFSCRCVHGNVFKRIRVGEISFPNNWLEGNATVILVDIVSHTNQETCTRREKDESRCTQNGLADGSFIK